MLGLIHRVNGRGHGNYYSMGSIGIMQDIQETTTIAYQSTDPRNPFDLGPRLNPLSTMGA